MTSSAEGFQAKQLEKSGPPPHSSFKPPAVNLSASGQDQILPGLPVAVSSSCPVGKTDNIDL